MLFRSYTVADVKGLVDRGVATAKQGTILLDGRLELMQSPGNFWLVKSFAAVSRMPGWSDNVVLDTSGKVLRGASDLMGYYSWGSNDPAIRDRHLKNTFAPGAIGGEFVSTDGRTFFEPPAEWRTNEQPYRGSHQSLIGDLIRDGITGVAGHVAEPYLNATTRPDILFPAYLSGFNLAESFYMAMPYLSWQTVVIGDPLCAPFRTHLVDAADIDAPVDPTTGLPGFMSERRVAAFAAKGAPREAALLLAKLAVLDARGDFEGGRAALERATAIAPSLVFPQMLLAARYEAVGAWDSAVARYKRILETSPTDAAALNNLAYVLAVRKGDPEGALPYAKRAITAPDRGPEAIDTLAWVHHLLGNDAEALPMIAAAASQLPDSAEVRLHAAAILAAVGNLAASKDQLERAVTLDASLEAHPGVEALRLKLNLSK